jgi:hypothetical protein
MMHSNYLKGSFKLSIPLTIEQINYFKKTLEDSEDNDLFIWTINNEGTYIIWNGKTNFLKSFHWICHIKKHILIKFGISMEGTVFHKDHNFEHKVRIIARAKKDELSCHIKNEPSEYLI